MNRFVGLLIVVVVLVGVLGFYLDWFQFSTTRSDDKAGATVTVDRNKIEADTEKAKEKLQHLGEGVKEKTGAAADRVKEEVQNP